MGTKLFLTVAAMTAFLSAPVLAQHGRGGGASSGGMHGSSASSSSMHGSDHSSSAHGNSDADHGSGHNASHSGHNSISERLTNNTRLAGKLQSLLPPGTDLQAASQGFKNLGQFVAAVHVSHNLGIPFDQLKAKMTGEGAESLGKAIHDLKPDANAKVETKKAETEAHQDMDNDSGK